MPMTFNVTTKLSKETGTGKADHMQPIYIEGGTCLIDEVFSETSLTLAEGKIVAIGQKCPRDALTLYAQGKYVLPGIIDIHGDTFERQIMPRPNVRFPIDMALIDTDIQLAANGITTAYHGVTLSWEPGLRSVEAGKQFAQALNEIRPQLKIDNRIQVRWETFAFEAIETVMEWMASDVPPAIAFNDHTSSTIRKLAGKRITKLREWAARCGLNEQDYLELMNDVWERRDEVQDNIRKVADAGKVSDCAMLSHDDENLRDRQMFRNAGVRISEFPMCLEAARDAKMHKEHIVLGAPNVVRGGSHNGSLNAADCIENGLCTILASDYYYPSMPAAIFKLVEDKKLSLEKAWALISQNPADALRLADRGRLCEGMRADVILVDVFRTKPVDIAATIAHGKIACLKDHRLFASPGNHTGRNFIAVPPPRHSAAADKPW